MDNPAEITNTVNNPGDQVVFANDVIATIAGLAAADVKGVVSLSGGVMEGFSEMLGKKSLTKGVKVEVGTEEVAADVSIVVQYGFKIQDVCAEVQKSVRKSVETMTGLRVVEVNVYVQEISFETETKEAKRKREKLEKAEDAEAVPVEQPRVK